MRVLLLVGSLALAPLAAVAACQTATVVGAPPTYLLACFSGGRAIYHDTVTEVVAREGHLRFTNSKGKRTYTTADCAPEYFFAVFEEIRRNDQFC